MAQWEKLNPLQKVEILRYDLKDVQRRIEKIETAQRTFDSELSDRNKTMLEIKGFLALILEHLQTRS
jgi:hypothetical protein